MQPNRAGFLKGTDSAFLRDALLRRDYDAPANMQSNVVIDTTNLSATETACRIFEELSLG
jgi:hypothetical protein